MDYSKILAGKLQMILEYVVVPEGKEMLKE